MPAAQARVYQSPLTAHEIEDSSDGIGRRVDDIYVAVTVDVPGIRLEVVVAHDRLRNVADRCVGVVRSEHIANGTSRRSALHPVHRNTNAVLPLRAGKGLGVGRRGREGHRSARECEKNLLHDVSPLHTEAKTIDARASCPVHPAPMPLPARQLSSIATVNDWRKTRFLGRSSGGKLRARAIAIPTRLPDSGLRARAPPTPKRLPAGAPKQNRGSSSSNGSKED